MTGLYRRCVVQAANRSGAAVGVGDIHDRHGLRDVQDSDQHETRVRRGLEDGDVRATKFRGWVKEQLRPRWQTQSVEDPEGVFAEEVAWISGNRT